MANRGLNGNSKNQFLNDFSWALIGYSLVNFLLQIVILSGVDKERLLAVERNKILKKRELEKKLNEMEPLPSVVTKMVKNLENYKYNEANEKTR